MNYKEALEVIANPIAYLQKEAEKDGSRINGGMAVQLSNDANWLKDIARKALDSAPLLREAAADMSVQDFYSGFNLDFMSEEEKQTIYTATELFAKGKVRGAMEEKEREIRELKKQMKNKDERWEESCRHWMSKANDRLKIIEAVESLALSRSQTLTAISGDEILKLIGE